MLKSFLYYEVNYAQTVLPKEKIKVSTSNVSLTKEQGILNSIPEALPKNSIVKVQVQTKETKKAPSLAIVSDGTSSVSVINPTKVYSHIISWIMENVSLLYLGIISLLLIGLIADIVKVKILLRNKILFKSSQEILNKIKVELGLKYDLKVYLSKRILTPTLIGLINPCILIPEKIQNSLEKKELENILLHEAIHIKRKDHIFVFCFNLVKILYFFNPMVWVAYSLAKKDMEIACDQTILRFKSENHKLEYAESLLKVALLCSNQVKQPVNSLAFIHKNKDTTRRIFMIANWEKTSKRNKLICTLVAILSLVVFLPTYKAIAEDKNISGQHKKLTFKLTDNQIADFYKDSAQFLKDQLCFNNVFIKSNISFNTEIFKNFEGSLEKFLEQFSKNNNVSAAVLNNDLFLTTFSQKDLTSMQNQLLEDVTMKAKLSQIANNFEILNKTHFEVLQQIAKGLEINLTTKGIFDNLNRKEFDNQRSFDLAIQEKQGLNAKSPDKKYERISFVNLFIGSLVTVPASTLFETKANEIILVDDQRWKEKYKELLDSEITIEKNKYTITDFILLYQEKFPDIIFVVKKNSLATQKIGLDKLITIEKGNYNASKLLQTELQKLNLSYDFNQEALIIKSTQDLNNEKQQEEFFRLASISMVDKQKDNMANKTIAQKLETPIFHDFTNLTMEKTIEIISKDCNINILWDSKVEGDIKKENAQLSTNGMSAKNVLKWLFANNSLVYSNIEQKFLLIKKAETFELAVEATISEIKKTETGVMIACFPTIPFDLSQENFKSKISFKNTEKDDVIFGIKIIAITNNLIYFEAKDIDFQKNQTIQLYINKVR